MFLKSKIVHNVYKNANKDPLMKFFVHLCCCWIPKLKSRSTRIEKSNYWKLFKPSIGILCPLIESPPPPQIVADMKNTVQSIALIPDSVIYRNSHMPDPESFSPAQKQLTVCFVHSLVFGFVPDFLYTGL